MAVILSRCGYRCDLCPAYYENVHTAEDRQRVSDGWYKYYGVRIPPDRVTCDGCRDDSAEARRVDQHCAVRMCVMARNLHSCAHCQLAEECEELESRLVTRDWVEERFGRVVPEWDYRRFVQPFEARELVRLRTEWVEGQEWVER